MLAECGAHRVRVCQRARLDLCQRAAIAVTTLVLEDRLPRRRVCECLQAAVDRRVDAITVDECGLTEALDHLGARHLGDPWCIELDVGAVQSAIDRYQQRRIARRGVDVAGLEHPAQHVRAATPRTLDTCHRIVARG